MTEWLPISSAPKDGSYILITRHAPGTQWHGRMEVDRCTTEKRFGTFNQWFPPTHFMPLPPPPETAA